MKNLMTNRYKTVSIMNLCNTQKFHSLFVGNTTSPLKYKPEISTVAKQAVLVQKSKSTGVRTED